MAHHVPLNILRMMALAFSFHTLMTDRGLRLLANHSIKNLSSSSFCWGNQKISSVLSCAETNQTTSHTHLVKLFTVNTDQVDVKVFQGGQDFFAEKTRLLELLFRWRELGDPSPNVQAKVLQGTLMITQLWNKDFNVVHQLEGGVSISILMSK